MIHWGFESRNEFWALSRKSLAALGLVGGLLPSLAGWVSLAPEAQAGGRIGRNACFVRGSSGERGRQMGIRNASRLVGSAWARLGQTCDQVDRLAMVVAETPLSRPYSGGEFAACFYQGYVDTLWDQLETVYTRCGNACFNAGVEVGAISANGYCAASLAIDGLLDPGFISQPPLPFCGQNLVFGCKTEYVHVATREFPGCRLYTEGYYAQTFDNFVRQDCFVPTDVPIRDGLY